MKYIHTLSYLVERKNIGLTVGVVTSIIFGLIYSTIIAHKFWQFEYFFVDNVYFHTAIWKLSQFQAPLILHQYLGEIHMFADHFSPAVTVIAIIYRLIPSHLTILLSMSVLHTIGGIFGVLIARQLKLPLVIWLPLLGAYWMYIAIQNSFLFGFHEIHLVAPLFLSTCWALLSKKWKTYWILLICLLLVKESMAIVVFGLGLFSLFVGKKYFKVAVYTILIGIGWYFLVTKLIIPYFSGGFVLYAHFELPTTPEAVIGRMTQPSEKIRTFVISLGSFGMFPLFQLATVPLVLQDFFVR